MTFPFSTLQVVLVSSSPVMPRRVLLALFRPSWMASSTLLDDDATICDTLATAINPSLRVSWRPTGTTY